MHHPSDSTVLQSMPRMPVPRTPQHQDTPAEQGGRVYVLPVPLLADRSHRYDWPDELQRLQRACREAWGTYAELDTLSLALPPDAPLARLALDAWHLWMRVEELAGYALESGASHDR